MVRGMNPSSVSFGLVVLAGVVSFLSPCVLSLVPAYVTYLSSRSITTEGMVIGTRRDTFTHGVAFVLGFSVVFITLGAAAGAAGALLFNLRDVLEKVGGVIVILFGLHTLGIIQIPFLEYDTRKARPPDRRWGYLSSSLMGVIFSAGWSPCVGPVLGAVLTLALTSNAVGRGVFLLAGYSIGLGIPFLLAAAGVGRVSELLKRHGSILRYANIVMGVLLIFIGILVFTGSLEVLANYTFVSRFQTSLDSWVVNFWHWLTGGH
jgi:cytochrome c-type biogenesis protein